MYIEFFGKLIVSLAITVLVIRRAVSAGSDYEVHQTPSARLKVPFILALAFFFVMLLASQTGLLVAAMSFDPSLPAWIIVFAGKLLLLSFVAGRLYRHQLPGFEKTRHLLLVTLLLLTTFAETVLILPAAWFVSEPRCDSKGVIMQTLQVTCIPSSLATICALYGEPVSEYEATRRVKTLLIGSLVGHSVSGCRNLGFAQASYSNQSLEQALAENLPFIITTETGISGIEHAVGVIGWRDGSMYLADPLRGLAKIGIEEFKKHWAGKIIRLGPRANAAKQPRLSDFSPDISIAPIK
ncbi:MAG: hypothetical protein CVV42_06960 [Candidatus Riflebacteria bacterium HGW-Riflebacteria-2]|nr:MAG: hypothetical protein CVV42_06960 [Candidatus Riflebacteria bacterium HGW-Riflebacteria-2]